MIELFQVRKLFFSLLIIPLGAHCQTSVKDTALLDSAIASARQVYTNQIAGGAHLYNGVEYKDYDLKHDDIGHPYFMEDDWLTGSIEYDGQLYEHVDIMYNIVRDKVVIDHPYSHFKVELISEKIGRFTISDHTFVRLVKDSAHTISTGFYDELYNGETKVYVKRAKEIQENLSARVVILEFTDHNKFFIAKNGIYYQVKNKASVLKVFYDRKTMLRKYLSKNKIRFKQNREFALKASAKFYDQSAAQ
jgi:hypothetical protein